jgi:hypothetical protein
MTRNTVLQRKATPLERMAVATIYETIRKIRESENTWWSDLDVAHVLVAAIQGEARWTNNHSVEVGINFNEEPEEPRR